jgi:hypothetical protein
MISNVQIAECLGWSRGWDMSYGALLGWKDNDGGFYTDLKQWTTDLNLCHELEDMLTDEEWVEYGDRLEETVYAVPISTEALDCALRPIINATALEKCTAWYQVKKGEK